jgi:hypothetical protein
LFAVLQLAPFAYCAEHQNGYNGHAEGGASRADE